MLNLECFEARLNEMQQRHPEMPRQSVMMVRSVLFLQRRLEDHLVQVLGRHHLSHSAWSFLMMIYSSPMHAINPSTAAEALRQSRPHMTRMTDELAERGWVERIQDSADRRAVEVRMTASGEAAVQELLPLMWQEYEQLLAGFSTGEADELGRLLRQWLINVEITAQQPAPAAISGKEML